MTEVVPAIIPSSFSDIEKGVAMVSPHVSRVQIDVVDGRYAPVTTWPFVEGDIPQNEWGKVSLEFPHAGTIRYELDCMVADLETFFWLRTFLGPLMSAYIFHVESVGAENLDSVFKLMRQVGNRELGLAIKPSTDPAVLDRWLSKDGVPDEIHFLQFMGNDNLGRHGVELDPRVYDHVRKTREKYPNLTIAVDIGVNTKTAPELVKAGVNKLVSGSAIFETANIEETIKAFQAL